MDAPRYSSLRDYLRVIRAHRVLIVLVTLAAGAAALVFSIREDRVYEATSSIAFQDETRSLGLLGTSVVSGAAPEQLPAARAETIDEPAVVRRVRSELRTKLSLQDLEGRIATSVDERSNLVRVTASGGTARAAARLADVFAEQAAAVTTRNARERFARGASLVRKRLRRVPNTLRNQSLRVALTDQLARLDLLRTQSNPARVVKSARVPSGPVSPKPVRNTAFGLLLGLLVALAAAFTRDSLDRRLRGTRAIESELGLPVVGHVRGEALGGAFGAADALNPKRAADVEAMRIVRQSLRFLSDEPLKTIVVTSAIPEEGKSTVAASLAAASAAAGKRTLLIDCDLRRPTVAERLGLDPAPGLVDFLVGDAEPRQLLQPIVQADPSSNGATRAWGEPLVCVAAGTPTPKPAELLGSERFRALLEDVAGVYDLVVLDSSPLLPVADTLEMLPHVDGVLLCVRSGYTTRDQALAGKAALARFPERPTGVVVTGISGGDRPDYGTYYSAYQGYASAPGEAARAEPPAATKA